MSNGEELRIRFEKLQALVEQLCQEQAAVTVRTWWTKEGTELVEIHRVAGAIRSSIPATNEVF